MSTAPEPAQLPAPPAEKAGNATTALSTQPGGGASGLSNSALLHASGPPAGGGQAGYPLLLPLGRPVQIPGRTGYSWLSAGGPAEPHELAALLLAALGGIARQSSILNRNLVVGVATRKAGSTDLTVPEVLRLGDRASWAAALRIFESETGMRMLHVLRSALDETELGAIMPYLRGVVPTAELLDIWDGFFSNDIAGILRTISRMPDAEALAMVADHHKTGKLTGTTAGSLFGKISSILGENDEGYRALLALADRFGRLATAGDGEAAGALAAQLRVKAAFLRIRQADSSGRIETAYLAVAALTSDERRALDRDYVSSWTSRNLPRAAVNRLRAMLSLGTEVSVIISALQSATSDEDQVGIQAAVGALGPALKRLGDRAGDANLPEKQRQDAGEELDNLANEPAIANLLLDTPGGDRLLTERLGLSNVEVVRYRLLRVTTGTELMALLRGLHGRNIRNLLELPDVAEHLKSKELQVEPHMLRVLDAYAEQAATPFEPVAFIAGASGVLHLPPGPGLVLEAPRVETEDPDVIVAGHRAYEAVGRKDLAGVVAAVSPLRGSQRQRLQNEPFFEAALVSLRRLPSGRALADILGDPYADQARAAEVLLAAGVRDDYGRATVRDERLLAQGLATDPADRRLMRYRYVSDVLAKHPMSLGAPAPLDLPDELDTAYDKRMDALSGVEDVPRLRAETAFLGEPEIMRPDITPEEAALEAEFMRVRLEKQLAAASSNVDVTGIFGWSPETVSEEAAEFKRVWELHGDGVPWTQPDLVRLAAAYYDALDAIDRNRTARDEAAAFVGNLAATVAGVVAVVATGGAATPAVLQILAATVAGGTAQMLVADQLRDYTAPEQQLKDFGSGAVTGALTVAGNLMARPAVAFLDKRMAGYVARGAVNKVLGGAAKLAVEGAIDGAVGGAGQAIFETAIDRATWERGVMAAFARFLKAAAEGAVIGGVTGAIAAPVAGGVFGGAGYLVRRLGGAKSVSSELAEALQRIERMADEGHFELALRHLDTLELTAAEREKLAAGLFERSVRSAGATLPDEMLQELEQARQLVREMQAGGKAPDVSRIEDVLTKLEDRLDAAEITHVRKLLYSEIRLSPQELIVKQNLFESALDDAVNQLTTSAERATMPAYEVRVLAPEAFEGMFRSRPGQAVTLLEGNQAVVYVRADAAVRTHMMQEAAHLAQFADAELAAQARLLQEANLADWARKAASDRLYFLDVQRHLEIDAQERIVRRLEPEEGFAGPEVQELAAARERLDELRAHDTQAKAITPDELARMNAGLADMPDWMADEARLFGTVKDASQRPATAKAAGKPHQVDNSPAAKNGRRVDQLGDEWRETTIVSTGYDGTVTKIEEVGELTQVTVTTEHGRSWVYEIEGGLDRVDARIRVGREVWRNDRLGAWSQQYRWIRVSKGAEVLRETQEVLNRKNVWVERGSVRTERSKVMELAAELQVKRDLTGLSFVAKRGSKASGFDRVAVEFHGEGRSMTAVIRILEVKDYRGRYVPYRDFSAVVENFDVNFAEALHDLEEHVIRLRASGEPDAARALRSAIKNERAQVEIWLGPGTMLGQESLSGSVMGQLRQAIQKNNVTLTPVPHRVDDDFHQKAIQLRKKNKK